MESEHSSFDDIKNIYKSIKAEVASKIDKAYWRELKDAENPFAKFEVIELGTLWVSGHTAALILVCSYLSVWGEREREREKGILTIASHSIYIYYQLHGIAREG